MEIIITKNEINNYSISEINYIRDTIENMTKFNQIEVLRLLHNKYPEVILNENKYGIHINLSELRKEILDELNLYIKYVNNQETNLNIIEKQKEEYINKFLTSKDITDISDT
jgi:hypothetical protein